MLRSALPFVLTVGCAYITDKDEALRLDPDGDGVPVGEDCDNTDASQGSPQSFYADGDGDGYGDRAVTAEACRPPDGFVANADDCDDADARAFPGNDETWYDGVDGDCAGDNDFDQDGDGFDVDTDCDDTDPERWPDPTIDEVHFNGQDDNCDASDGDGDQDGDGYWADDYVTRCNANSAIPMEIPEGREGDCWDDPSTTPADQETAAGFPALTAPDVHPGATETWYDGADQDCSGGSDFDQDGDGHDAMGETVSGMDCDDTTPAVNPDQAEIEGDGIDNDCSGDANGNGIEGSESLSVADGVRYATGVAQQAGLSVSTAGDVDADGRDDVLMGSPYDDTLASNGGAAFLHAGPATGIAPATTGVSLFGDQAAAYFGYALSELGDQNGDGFADFAVGAYNEDARGFNDGVVHVFLGPLNASGNASALHDSHYFGSASNASAGSGLASGDVDGDGTADLLIGGFHDEQGGTDAGRAWVVLGPATGGGSLATKIEISPAEAGGSLGIALAGDDLTGDGVGDFTLGAYTLDTGAGSSTGAAYVLEGPVTANATAGGAGTVLEVYGTGQDDMLGRSLSTGDITGDGYTDLLVGAPSAGPTASDLGGAVYVVEGPVAGSGSAAALATAVLYGNSTSSFFGASLDATGDVDGDGFSDILIGDPLQSNRATFAGALWLVRGPLTATTTLSASQHAERHSTTAYDFLGVSASIAGDVDADGYDDVFVGVYGDDTGAESAGASYLFLGGAL